MAYNMLKSDGHAECVNTIPNCIEIAKEVQLAQNNVSLEQEQESTKNNKESRKITLGISNSNSGFSESDNGTGELDPEISNPQFGTTQLLSEIVDMKIEASYEDEASQPTSGENNSSLSSVMKEEDKQSFVKVKKNCKAKSGKNKVAHPKTTLKISAEAIVTDNKENEESVTVNVVSTKTTKSNCNTKLNMTQKLRLRI